MSEHNRYARNCSRFPTKVGPDTQYLIDWHRGETCPVCACPGCDCEPIGYAPHNGNGLLCAQPPQEPLAP